MIRYLHFEAFASYFSIVLRKKEIMTEFWIHPCGNISCSSSFFPNELRTTFHSLKYQNPAQYEEKRNTTHEMADLSLDNHL